MIRRGALRRTLTPAARGSTSIQDASCGLPRAKLVGAQLAWRRSLPPLLRLNARFLFGHALALKTALLRAFVFTLLYFKQQEENTH